MEEIEMLAIRDLQEKVNQIAFELGGLGGLDTNEKLEQARLIARDDKEIHGLLIEILDEALTRRWNRDMGRSIKRFLDSARA